MSESFWLGSVAIVGRPNVGKSSLFNRILGQRKAIVEDEPGTTRDRVEAEVEWRDARFRLVDTGGYETDDTGPYAALISEQVVRSITEADLVVFCVDARDGLTPGDEDMAALVRESSKPVILVATKADNISREEAGVAEAWRLGLGEALPLSALHDINIGVLLDEILERLPPRPHQPGPTRVRIAIIGRPNVGKSMLLNALAGAPRAIVSDVAGTTRDAIDTELSGPQGDFLLVDTAGVRRPGKQGVGVERHSVTRTKDAIAQCDVAVLVIDGTEGVTAQDAHIAGLAVDAAKGLIIAVNKIDLWEDPAERRRWLERQMRGRLRFLPWAMVCHISALEGRGGSRVAEPGEGGTRSKASPHPHG